VCGRAHGSSTCFAPGRTDPGCLSCPRTIPVGADLFRRSPISWHIRRCGRPLATAAASPPQLTRKLHHCPRRLVGCCAAIRQSMRWPGGSDPTPALLRISNLVANAGCQGKLVPRPRRIVVVSPRTGAPSM